MKGIILAGGKGTRLYPLTLALSKQLLPIYDKPMIYYPLSVLMLAGIREILIISSPEHIDLYKNLLGDGSQIGCKFSYKIQDKPRGLADAFIVGEDFIGDDNVCLILGDNILYSDGLGQLLQNTVKTINSEGGSYIFAYNVKYPEQYGIVEFDDSSNVLSIEEKPKNPKSNYAVIGLYFYDNDVVKFAHRIEPSNRGEIEITDVNKLYLKKNKLKVELLGRGFAWLDAGTYSGLIDAGNFIKTVQERQGYIIACLEEIAYKMNYISKRQLQKTIKLFSNSEYCQYLQNLL